MEVMMQGYSQVTEIKIGRAYGRPTTRSLRGPALLPI